jgi:dipeptidyl aminopeptidase/acylaminoacyl peptidase
MTGQRNSAVTKAVLAIAAVLGINGAAPAQQTLDLETITAALDKDGKFVFERAKVVLLKYDFEVNGEAVEAIAFRPAAEGKFPGVVLIPGYSRTARDYVPMGIRFAREGMAALAITQRGFGKSAGQPDFVGPKTMAAIEAGFRKFRGEPYVDPARMGVFGYSRGAMAASLLAVNLKPDELKAAVFGAGIYDFRKAYDEIKLAGIRENMEKEAGLSAAAVAERSSITKMESLACPVLILHGEKDENAPVGQARMLHDRLRELKKDVEIKLFRDRDHDLGRQNVNDHVLPFFKKHLVSTASAKGTPKP